MIRLNYVIWFGVLFCVEHNIFSYLDVPGEGLKFSLEIWGRRGRRGSDRNVGL
jgi:hypothetical protein